MLRTLKLHGDLADFIGHKELEAVINSTADAIRFLITNFEGLEAHMANRHYQVLVGDEDIDETEVHNPIGQSDISIVPVITGAGGNVGKIFLGAALIGVGMVSGGITFASFFNPAAVPFAPGFASAGLLTKGTIAIGGALVLSGVSDMLFPVPKMPDFSNEEDPRISFSFSGVQNTSRAGTSHPIAYGEIVTGSVVISAGIDTNQVTA